MQRSIWMIVVLGLVLPSAAWARASKDQIVGRSADCIVDRGVGAFDIPVHPG